MSEDQLLNDPAMAEGIAGQVVAPETPHIPEPVAKPKTGLKPARTPISELAKQYQKGQKPKYECMNPESINSGFEAVVGMFNNDIFHRFILFPRIILWLKIYRLWSREENRSTPCCVAST